MAEFQLPQEMAGLQLEEICATESPSTAEVRTLRKRQVDSPTVKVNSKRRCLKMPKKHETMSQIKKLYLNLTFKPPNPQNLETIFEEDTNEEEEKLGKQKIRRSILFRDGAVTKMKIKHRKRMVKRLEATGFVKHKRVRLSLAAVLERLSEDQAATTMYVDDQDT